MTALICLSLALYIHNLRKVNYLFMVHSLSLSANKNMSQFEPPAISISCDSRSVHYLKRWYKFKWHLYPIYDFAVFISCIIHYSLRLKRIWALINTKHIDNSMTLQNVWSCERSRLVDLEVWKYSRLNEILTIVHDNKFTDKEEKILYYIIH